MTVRLNLDFPLWPGGQQDFFRAVVAHQEKKFCAFIGGIQTGKGYTGSRAFFSHIVTAGGGGRIWWIVSPTYDLGEIAWRDFLEVIPEGFVTAQKESIPREVTLRNGDHVVLKTAQKTHHLRGERVSGIWWDEAGQCAEEVHLVLLGRLARMDGKLIMTTTPCGAESPWLNQLFKDHERDPDYFWANAKIDENLAVSRRRIEQLRSMYPGDYGTEELDGQFIERREGLVYGKIWDPRAHLIHEYTFDPDEEDLEMWGDHGLTNPSAILWAAIHRKTERITLMDELYERELPASDLVAKMKARGYEKHVEVRYIDPAAKGLRAEMFKAGLMNRAAKNDVREGIQACFALLAATGRDEDGKSTAFRVVATKCRNFVKEIGTYRYKRRTQANADEEPFKWLDHAMDAWRYGVYSGRRSEGLVGATTAEKIGAAKRLHGKAGTWTKTLPDGRRVLEGVTPPRDRKKTLDSYRRCWHN